MQESIKLFLHVRHSTILHRYMQLPHVDSCDVPLQQWCEIWMFHSWTIELGSVGLNSSSMLESYVFLSAVLAQLEGKCFVFIIRL
jgi:hypothetical protein